MKKPIFALVDCNNFFVSCERIFRPDLKGKPVVVLSSGDGCVVARSNEAKVLGVPMAAPVFKYRHLFKARGVTQFSGNFELYGDISRRITDVLTSVTPKIEVYSVDESFLDLSELVIDDYEAWGRAVRDRVWQWIGVPVSIGIAPSKTLAKLAVNHAKKHPALNGVLALFPPSEKTRERTDLSHLGSINRYKILPSISVKGPSFHTWLRETPVENVWGIGWRLAPKLRAEGIHNALRLSQMRPQRARQLMGIHGRQLVAELNGVNCYPLEREGKARQSITRTRTFGEDTADIGALEAALASFATKAAFRLRADHQLARRAGVFAATNQHKPGYRTWQRETHFPVPTADTGKLIATAVGLFHEFYNARVTYHRAGIWLGDFVSADHLQTDMFGTVNIAQESQSQARMQTIDAINERFGRSKVRYATEGLGSKWQPKHRLHSPRYVSHWDELPIVNGS